MENQNLGGQPLSGPNSIADAMQVPRLNSSLTSEEQDKGNGNKTLSGSSAEDALILTGNVQHLRNEVDRLKAQLSVAQQQRKNHSKESVNAAFQGSPTIIKYL